LQAAIEVMEDTEFLSTSWQDDKTAFPAGSGLMLEKLLNAVNKVPAFERFVTARFPVDQLRDDFGNTVKIEAEIVSSLEHDPDGVSVVVARIPRLQRSCL